jgi:hypothetical protein
VAEDALDEDDDVSDGSFQSLALDGAVDVFDTPIGGPGAQPTLDSANWMVAKRLASAARERTQAPATAQLQAEVRLLELLTRHKAPLCLFPEVQQWARDSANLQHDFSRNIRLRSTVLSEIEERHDMEPSRFKPTLVSHLPDERPTVVHVASFADAVCSLLSDPELMKPENLAFPHPDNPFLPEPKHAIPRLDTVQE